MNGRRLVHHRVARQIMAIAETDGVHSRARHRVNDPLPAPPGRSLVIPVESTEVRASLSCRGISDGEPSVLGHIRPRHDRGATGVGCELVLGVARAGSSSS